MEGIKKATEKLTRYSSHSLFLTECLTARLIPRGMQLQFGREALPKSDYLLHRLDSILHTTSLNIMRDCRDTYATMADAQRSTLDGLMYDMFQSRSYEEYEVVRRRQINMFRSFKQKLSKTKTKKLSKLKEKYPEAGDKTPTSKRRCRRFQRQKRPLGPVVDRSTYTRKILTDGSQNTVINLSQAQLTEEQTRVLSLGPKFCPTPQRLDEQRLAEDIREGCRRLRLRELFFDPDLDTAPRAQPKFYKKSYFQPKPGRDKGLDAYCSTIQSLTEGYKPTQKPRENMTKGERQAMEQLRGMVQNREIRISKADKGGAVVVLDVQQYLEEAHRQLENTAHYTAVKKDPTFQVAKTSNNILSRLHDDGLIDDTTYRWAIVDPNNVRPHLFYHLPKVHKTLDRPPGRPIVSGTGGPTETISKLVDHWLRNIVTTLPSYVQDTTHMLRTIAEWNEKFGPFGEDTMLVTIDVTSLYTNIPQPEIETAIRQFMMLRPNPDIPPVERVLEAARHVLDNNYFSFESKTYKQISGTAMGTPMAPTVANLFMGMLETQLLEQSPVMVDPEVWKRFIDDILILWRGTAEDLDAFLSFINSFHPSIKFTVQSSRDQIPFLDILLKLRDGFIQTDMYTKSTDAHAYLHFKSCHPRHCVKNVPYSQYLRVRRLCSEEDDFQKNSEAMTRHFRRRGYPESLLAGAKEKAGFTQRTLEYKATENSDRVPFVITHHPLNPPLRKWLTEFQPVLHTSHTMKQAVPLPPVVGERNCRSLKNLLMPSALPRAVRDVEPGCFRCTKTRCVLCKNHLSETKTFESVETKEVFTIRERLSCDASNVVYLLSCAKCSRQCQYVGQTKNPLKERFYQHTFDIRQNRGTLVTEHFNLPGHSVADMRCLVIETVHIVDLGARLRREDFWRRKLKTLAPHGLNVLDELNAVKAR